MKKLITLTKTLLVLAGLCVGVNAWAYTLPDGFEIKTVYIGTNNGNGTVTSDAFDYESVPATWVAQDANAAVAIGNKTNVANVAVGSTPESEPTYVDGKTLQVTVSGTNWTQHWVRYTLADAVSTGKLVFRADMYQANSPTFIRFLDADGNELLKLGFNNGSNDRYYQYYVKGGSATNSDMHTVYRTYHGFSIEDLVLDMTTGSVSFYLDYINTNSSNQRAQVTNTKTINFGTGKAVKYLEVGSTVNSSQTVHFDNIQFYHVAEAGKNNYEIYARAGETNLQLLASGQKAKDEEYSATGLPLVIKYNNQYYTLDDANVTNYATPTYTMGNADETKYITYTLDETIVYFEEGESLCSSSYAGNYSGGYAAAYRSAGDMNHLNKFNSTVISETGAYKADIYVTGGISNGRSFNVYKVENEALTAVGSVSFSKGSSASTGLYSTSNFLVKSGTTLYTGGIYNTLDIDYLIIRKIADVIDINHEFVGAFDFSSEANAVRSSDFSLKQGETKVFTFQNHGTTFGNNWRIEVKEGETWKANVCADSYDYTANTPTNVTSYKESKDGGATQIALNWDDYAADMADARVVATLTYGTDGKLAIRTTSTGTANGYIYYVDHDVAGLTSDLTINLSVCKSWLEVISVEPVISVTVGAAGYATLCPAVNLNFENATNIEARTAKVDATTGAITYSKVNTVAAGEGVVLASLTGEAVEEIIPVISSATANENNDLVGIPEKVKLEQTSGDYTNYVLAIVNDEIGFYKVNTNGTWCKAGSAYLKVATSTPTARGFFPMWDDATGINDVKNLKSELNGEVYNLNGQRVNNPTKGLYIVNGKKVLLN